MPMGRLEEKATEILRAYDACAPIETIVTEDDHVELRLDRENPLRIFGFDVTDPAQQHFHDYLVAGFEKVKNSPIEYCAILENNVPVERYIVVQMKK